LPRAGLGLKTTSRRVRAKFQHSGSGVGILPRIQESDVIDNNIKFASAADDLMPAPIDPSWIQEGSPVARIKFMSGSSDGMANTYIWDCTAGRFNWKYGFDETACILEGSIVVKDEKGVSHSLKAGDTMFFPSGSNADWIVPQYVRKVAILRNPLSPRVVLIARIYNKLRRMISRDDSKGGNPATF
jgi:uncharacterized protein